MAKSIAVLVGKKASKLRFNHSIKLKRAVNSETLERMVSVVNFAIIEGINSSEEEHVKRVIAKLKSESKAIYFFPDLYDEVTMGVADELEYPIYNSLDALCSAIESEQNIKVTSGFGLNLVANDVDSSNDFGQTDEMSEAIKELEQNELEQAEIKHSETESTESKEESFTGFSTTDEHSIESTQSEIPKQAEVSQISQEELSAELDYLPESVSNEINRLKMQLSDLNYDYSLAVEDMRVATERIGNLEKIIATLKDEKECMQAEFDSIIQTNEVLEDPISLSTYQKTVDDLNAREKQVEELEGQVAELKQTVEKDKDTIANKINEIDDLSSKLSKIEDELGAINDSIASGEIHKEVIAEFTAKLESIKNEKDEAIKEANELKIKASTDASTIGLLNKNLVLETEYRYTSVELFIELIDKLNDKIAELNSTLAEKATVEEKLSSSEENLESARTKIDELSELEKKLKENEEELSEKQIELESLQTTLEISKKALEESAVQLADRNNALNQANEQVESLKVDLQKNIDDSEAKLNATISEKDAEMQKALDEKDAEMQAALTARDTEYTETINRQSEEASQALESLRKESKETEDRLTAEITELKEQNESKDSELASNNEKIESLESELTDKNSEIEDLNATVESLNSVIDTKDAQLESKDTELSAKDEQLDQKESTIESLNNSVADRDKSIKSKEYAILEKDRELSEKSENIEALNASIEVIEAKHSAEMVEQSDKINELTSKIDELNESIKSKEYTIGVQSVDIEEHEKDIELLKADVESEKKHSETLEAKLRRADERFKSTLERLKVSGGDIEKLMAEVPGALSPDDIQRMKDELEKAEAELKESNAELERIKQEYTELNDKYTDSVKQLSENTKSITSKTEELTSANITIQQLKSKIEQLENEVTTLESVKTGASSDEVEAIKNQNSTLVEKNSALTEQINEYITAERESKRQLARMESEIETYKSLVAELQNDNGSSNGQCTIGSIKYNRGAQIISVFGNRSCGITTLAASIARKLSLSTNVLYIDFDMIAPKGDVLFKKIPIVNIRGVQNTSLGAMSAFSSSLTASEIKGLAIGVDKTKGGKLDYFSGYYYKPVDSVIAATDFQKMFDTLGEYYDYIIIDLGKIGASTFNNSIITEIVKISNKSIAISNHDLFNVKAMLRTLNTMNINSKSVAWAINKVPENQVSTQGILSMVSPKIMEALSGCKVGAFADDLKLRGLPLDFSAGSRSNKINFEMFLAQTVFG